MDRQRTAQSDQEREPTESRPEPRHPAHCLKNQHVEHARHLLDPILVTFALAITAEILHLRLGSRASTIHRWFFGATR